MALKIIRITTLLDFGGQERKYLLFSEDATLLKNQYFFAAIGHGGHASQLISNRGFSVMIFNQNPAIKNLKNIWILYKWFRKIQPDIVHTAAAEANFHGVIAAKLAGVKVIIAEEIGFPNHSRFARLVFKNCYRLVDKVVCVSQAVKDYLFEIQELSDSDKGIVIYNPVSTPKVVEAIQSEMLTIVSVGRLEAVKNQQLLVRAFARLEDKNSKLILVGDGRERTALEKLIRELNIENRVEITGFTSEPEHYLAQADLFVLASHSEGFGIAVVEAMQLGLPCLCSNVGGIPEFVAEGETGWLFDPKKETEFFDKLSSITKLSAEELFRIGANAKRAVRDRFSSQKYVSNLEKLYQELV